MKKSILISAAAVVLTSATIFAENSSDKMEQNFATPPADARPWTWWHWMNGNISKQGITGDLEAMQAAGVGGFQMFDVAGGPAGNVPFASDEFRELVKHSIDEATRLGLKFGLHNGGGWCASGGPWVTPEHSMKIVVSSEVQVAGGQQVSAALPQPQTNLGFYRDVAVLAIPAAESERFATPAEIEEIRTNIPGLTKEVLLDNDSGTAVPMVSGIEGETPFFEIVFKEPFTARSATIRPAADVQSRYHQAVIHLSVSNDGVNFQPVNTSFRSFNYDSPNFEVLTQPLIAGFPEVTGRVFRFEAKNVNPRDFALSDVSLSSGYRVPSLLQLTQLDMWWTGNGMDLPSAELGDGAVDPAKVINLTGKMNDQGVLNWDAPSGNWTILRIGYTTVTTTNVSARPGAGGLEVDKLSSESVKIFWDGYVGKLFEENKEALGGTIASVLVDSWEVGGLNWTSKMPEEFQKRRGYDMMPFLPVLAGRVVDNPEATARFLWDFRRTISDLFQENYPTTMRELANRDGVKFYVEGYDSPCDQIDYGGAADVPTAEFWMVEAVPGHATGRSWTCRTAASSGHVYGRNIIAAEAFTGSEFETGWVDHPFYYKELGDLAFTTGINQFLFHRFAHQPFEGVKPGMVMDHWGSHFDRHNTWWPYASGFMTYLARCQELLRQGDFAGDIAYYIGEDVPFRKVAPGMLQPPPPPGYDHVAVGRNGLLNRARVEQGQLTFGGCDYSVLVLPKTNRMSLKVIEKIAQMVNEGLTVYGPKPELSPSMEGGPDADAKVRKLADELWGDCDGRTVKEHRYGKGRVVWGLPLAEVIGKPAAFAAVTSPEAEVNFIHRQAGDTDIFFVANRSLHATTAHCTFRVQGMQPEIWYPDTGRMERIPVFEEGNGTTSLDIEFPPAGSVFVVFREKIGPNLPWKVEFKPDSPRPAPAPWKSRLTVEEATYTNPDGTVIEATKNLRRYISRIDRIWDGTIAVPVNPGLLGIPGGQGGGRFEVTYLLDGERIRDSRIQENLAVFTFASIRDAYPVEAMRTVETEKGPQALVSTPGVLKVVGPNGKATEIRVEGIPSPVQINGPWDVKFGENGPEESVRFAELTSWHKSEIEEVKFFSGTAVYTTSFEVPKELLEKGNQLLLDLGDVREIAALKINGTDAGILWKPPYRTDVTPLLRAGKNTLAIEVTNTWANRLIGDERFPRDYEVHSDNLPVVTKWPDWLVNGTARPESRRKAFTTFHIFREDSPLRPSGLLGPVQLVTVREIGLAD